MGKSKQGQKDRKVENSGKTAGKEIPMWLTATLLFAAAGMCIYGALRGEMHDVLIKAVNICMECIGLG